MYSIKVTKDKLNTASLDDLLTSMDALEYFLDIMDARRDNSDRYYEYASLSNAVSAEINRRRGA